MHSRILATAVAAALLTGSAAAHAQQATKTTSSTAATADHKDSWRMTKLMGLDVYNDGNEKIGDINEVLIDTTGDVKSVVIGVGGFLDMGERNVAVPMEHELHLQLDCWVAALRCLKHGASPRASPG